MIKGFLIIIIVAMIMNFAGCQETKDTTTAQPAGNAGTTYEPTLKPEIPNNIIGSTKVDFVDLEKAEVGDIVLFGKNDLAWWVVEEKEDEVILLCAYIVDSIPIVTKNASKGKYLATENSIDYYYMFDFSSGGTIIDKEYKEKIFSKDEMKQVVYMKLPSVEDMTTWFPNLLEAKEYAYGEKTLSGQQYLDGYNVKRNTEDIRIAPPIASFVTNSVDGYWLKDGMIDEEYYEKQVDGKWKMYSYKIPVRIIDDGKGITFDVNERLNEMCDIEYGFRPVIGVKKDSIKAKDEVISSKPIEETPTPVPTKAISEEEEWYNQFGEEGKPSGGWEEEITLTPTPEVKKEIKSVKDFTGYELWDYWEMPYFYPETEEVLELGKRSSVFSLAITEAQKSELKAAMDGLFGENTEEEEMLECKVGIAEWGENGPKFSTQYSKYYTVFDSTKTMYDEWSDATVKTYEVSVLYELITDEVIEIRINTPTIEEAEEIVEVLVEALGYDASNGVEQYMRLGEEFFVAYYPDYEWKKISIMPLEPEESYELKFEELGDYILYTRDIYNTMDIEIPSNIVCEQEEQENGMILYTMTLTMEMDASLGAWVGGNLFDAYTGYILPEVESYVDSGETAEMFNVQWLEVDGEEYEITYASYTNYVENGDGTATATQVYQIVAPAEYDGLSYVAYYSDGTEDEILDMITLDEAGITETYDVHCFRLQ